jgi:hypothetical protein
MEADQPGPAKPATGNGTDADDEDEDEETLEPTPPRQRQARLDRLSKSRSVSQQTDGSQQSRHTVEEMVSQSKLPLVAAKTPQQKVGPSRHTAGNAPKLATPGKCTGGAAADQSRVTSKKSSSSSLTSGTGHRYKVSYKLVYEDEDEERFERVIIQD